MSDTDKVQDTINSGRRRLILEILSKYGGALPLQSLTEAIRATFHIYVDNDLITDDAGWLATRDLISRPDQLSVAITGRGENVLRGTETVSGVKRPPRIC
ncbi:MAG: hypothetical protein ORN98_11275 [Alphaproteobacteria bacterium]|nr:hypothetical protein [Alphaproteobacteria bacterium]